MLQRNHYDTREDWLLGRLNGIGGSDAAAVVGISPFMTNVDVFNLKTLRVQSPDLSSNPNVAFGSNAEAPLRELFALKNPQYKVEHYPYDILFQSEQPFICASLDGEITEIATKRRGVLEVKTGDISKRVQRLNWDDRIPQHYYVQVCHQFSATAFDFVDVFALLTTLNGDCFLRTYHFERAECERDIEWLTKREIVFWKNHYETDIPPNLILPGLTA